MPSDTTDLGLAAALLTLGYEFSGLRSGEETQKVFCFEIQTDTLRGLSVQYHSGLMQVDAYRNAQSIKKLKRLLYQAIVPNA